MRKLPELQTEKTAGFYKTVKGVVNKNPQVFKTLGYGAAGTAFAAGENELLGEFLPDALKKINLGLGAGTGALMALGGKKGLIYGLGSLPVKQMGLFGVGSFENAQKQKRDLMGLELHRAATDLNTAEEANKGQKSKRFIDAGILAAALLGAGSLASHVHDNRKYTAWHEAREKEKDDRRKERESKKLTATKGTPSRRRDKVKIKLDIPASSLPEGMLDSFFDLDDQQNASSKYTAA